MIVKSVRYLIATAISSSLLLAGCSKQIEEQPAVQSQVEWTRTTGALEEDPVKASKVPLVISSDLINGLKKGTIQIEQLAKGSGGTGGKRDGTAPALSIVSPTAGATVSGTIEVKVNAADNVGVKQVTLKVDGMAAGSSTTAPFTIAWNSASVADGLHTLTLTAFDAAGNSSSQAVQVTVKTISNTDITNPTVSISSPANGATVSGTVSIAASASDNVGVSSVTFSVDGVNIGTDNAAPFSSSWNSSQASAGLHTITATAADAAGNKGTHSIQVSINTTVIEPSPLPSSVLLAMPAVTSQGSEGSCVAFAVAYAARSSEQFYRTNASSFSYNTNIFSPEYLFNQIKTGDCGASSVLTALDLVVSKGVCTWSSMPYSSTNGCSLMPTASQDAEASNYRISSYAAVYTSDITAMKTMLANKHPLVMTFANENNFNKAYPGYIWNSFDGSSGYGSHAITICGYDDAKHAYKAINSWGTGWGDAGYIWIDYDFLPQVKSTVYMMK